MYLNKQYILWAQCAYVRSTSRSKYILFGYMDPKGNGGFVLMKRVLGVGVLGLGFRVD